VVSAQGPFVVSVWVVSTTRELLGGPLWLADFFSPRPPPVDSLDTSSVWIALLLVVSFGVATLPEERLSDPIAATDFSSPTPPPVESDEASSALSLGQNSISRLSSGASFACTFATFASSNETFPTFASSPSTCVVATAAAFAASTFFFSAFFGFLLSAAEALLDLVVEKLAIFFVRNVLKRRKGGYG